jgi:polysaccharide chain length determinant protein (PEP-CTERM system associated)
MMRNKLDKQSRNPIDASAARAITRSIARVGVHEMPVKRQAGRPTMADYGAIVRRRYWWIMLPVFFCWLVVWATSWFLPPTYQSEALILVQQQKITESYVASNVTVDLQDRLQSMTQQILSRTRLQRTIDRFHLYAEHRRLAGLAPLQDPIDLMRKDIKIDLVRSPGRAELTSFKIQYSAGSPELAQQVNSELTSLFIDENLKAQQQQSETTTGFLNSELAAAKAKLEEQEAKVRFFKTSHFGDLPSQMQTNVQILSGLQTQLQTAQRDLDSAKQQKLYLASLIEQYDSQQSSLDRDGATATPPEALDRELMDLRSRLAEARLKYTDRYPDVIALQDKISKTEKLRKQVEEEISSHQKADHKPEAAGYAEATTTHATTTPSMMQVQSQLKANELEISNYQKGEKEIESQISDYQARLNMTPETEQELADISRGYDESMSNYNSLLQKQMQSQLATNLEQRQQGEQFSILDPPSLPNKPSSPNHVKLSVAGLFLGLVLGIAFTVLLEKTRVRVWRADTLQGIVPARILVALPHLSTPREDQRGAVVRLLKIAVTVAMVLLIVAGHLYAMYRG